LQKRASGRIKKSKRDVSIFSDICAAIGFKPYEVIFVDDNAEHIKRASVSGLKTIYFTDIATFSKEMSRFIKL
jgi:HAD superfamily hydrolase (TIGR01509 family)